MISLTIPLNEAAGSGDPLGKYTTSREGLQAVEAWDVDTRREKYAEIFEGGSRSRRELRADAARMPAAILSFVLADAYFAKNEPETFEEQGFIGTVKKAPSGFQARIRTTHGKVVRCSSNTREGAIGAAVRAATRSEARRV